MAVKKTRQRVPRTRAGETWTESRYWQFIRSALRQAFNRYPAKFQARKQAERRVKGKRHKYEYQCAACGKWFKAKEIQVDHIEPAGSLKEYGDLAGFVERLFCEADGMQVMCKECHNTKTQLERKKRT
jgi:5-methylcytosine-specific restriction endonuclease McrA